MGAFGNVPRHKWAYRSGFVLIIGFLGFVILGFFETPYLYNLINPPTAPPPEVSTIFFNINNIQAQVTYTVSGQYLAENTPVTLEAQAFVPFESSTVQVFVMPINGFTTGRPQVYLKLEYNNSIDDPEDRKFVGQTTLNFSASGQLSMEIDVTYPNSPVLQYTNLTSIELQSYASLQTQIQSENDVHSTIALTFFILGLGFLEIGIQLFEMSVDKERQKEIDHAKKKERKRKENEQESPPYSYGYIG